MNYYDSNIINLTNYNLFYKTLINKKPSENVIKNLLNPDGKNVFVPGELVLIPRGNEYEYRFAIVLNSIPNLKQPKYKLLVEMNATKEIRSECIVKITKTIMNVIIIEKMINQENESQISTVKNIDDRLEKQSIEIYWCNSKDINSINYDLLSKIVLKEEASEKFIKNLPKPNGENIFLPGELVLIPGENNNEYRFAIVIIPHYNKSVHKLLVEINSTKEVSSELIVKITKGAINNGIIDKKEEIEKIFNMEDESQISKFKDIDDCLEEQSLLNTKTSKPKDYYRLAVSLLGKNCPEDYILEEQKASNANNNLDGGEIVVVYQEERYQFGYVHQTPQGLISLPTIMVDLTDRKWFTKLFRLDQIYRLTDEQINKLKEAY